MSARSASPGTSPDPPGHGSGAAPAPTISVLVDTYNQARYLPAALDSVFAQEGVPADAVEVVVVDDGSIDGTREVAAAYGDRIRLISKPNGGQASAFNAGLAACRHDVVCGLDGDDWWAPGKLAAVRAAFVADPGLVAVGHGIVEEVERRDREGTGVDSGPGGRIVAPAADLRFDLHDAAGRAAFVAHKACLGTSRFAARTDILQSLGPIPENLIYEADEYWFTLVGAVGPVAVLARPLAHYRLHGANLFQRAGHPARDRERLRGRAAVFACLADALPPALAARGLEPDAVDQVMEPVRVEAARLRLTVEGGMPWETVAVMRRWKALTQPDPGPADRAVKVLGLAAAAVLPPRLFFGLQRRYAYHGLGRLRARLTGDPS